MKPIKDWTDEDVILLRVRVDGWCRKMILGTAMICTIAIFAAWLWQNF